VREPRFIELDDAVSRIKQACESRPKDSSPFFFLVGAGISHPSVPLAKDIINHCKKVAEDRRRSVDVPGVTGVDQYSNWFQTAYSEPYQRQEYLQQLIENKSITHANFRLAHLLLDNTISNIVVATNFDDFLSKALALFGKSHIVCDHPQTVGRINHAQPMLQIVHLHGSYSFYDCCNLRGELEDRAQQSQHTTLTMASLLVNILWDRSPLVIGYSGWEGDVFMEAFRRRLAQPLKSNAYWFCYRRSEIDLLPEWLKSHANISFVIQRKTSVAKPNIGAAVEQTQAHQGSVEGIEVTGLSKKDAEPVLAADTVLSRLIQAFNLAAPTLTKDPLGFFAAHLDNSLPKDPASDSDSSDIYAIKRVIERVRKAKEREDEESAKTRITPAESHLERVRDALRRADYREVIQEGARIDLAGLSLEQLSELVDAFWAAAEGLSDNSEDELAAYQLVVATLRQVERTQGFELPASRIRLAGALYHCTLILNRRNRYQEALPICDEVVQHYGSDVDVDMQELVAKSLISKSFAVAMLKRNEDVITICDEVIRRLGEISSPAVNEQVAKALTNKSFALIELKRHEDAIAIYDEVVSRFGEASTPGLEDLVTKALFNKGFLVAELNRREDAIAIYDEVVRRIGEASAPVLKQRLAMALYNNGINLHMLNRHEDAVTLYDKIVSRFGEDSSPELIEQVARAQVNKGFELRELERYEEAMAAYDNVISRFGHSGEPALKEQVGKARLGKTFLPSPRAGSGRD